MANVIGPLIGSIDEGTSSARFVLFKAETAEVVCFHQRELSQIMPREGWVEQDPMDILQVVEECIEKTVEKLIALGGKLEVMEKYQMHVCKHCITLNSISTFSFRFLC